MRRAPAEFAAFLSQIRELALFSSMMKLRPLILLTTAALLLGAPCVATAEPPKIDHVIELLHRAQDSANPLPLLQKAQNELGDFKAAPNGRKEAAAGIGRRRIAGNAVGAHENKRDAMEAIKGAIAAAKSGGNVKPKIEHAIAMAHKAGDLKR